MILHLRLCYNNHRENFLNKVVIIKTRYALGYSNFYQQNDVDLTGDIYKEKVLTEVNKEEQTRQKQIRQEDYMHQAEQVHQTQLIIDIREKIKGIHIYTPKVGVFGNSGVGKSSLCNALFGQDVAKIGDVEACTKKPQEVLIGNNGGKSGIILVDVPGIGESSERQEEYIELYKNIIPELDLILWLIKADDRSYASSIDDYNAMFAGEDAPPVVFVITQTDKTNDTDDWEREIYRPGKAQEANIANKESDISSRFNVPPQNIISIAIQVKDKKLTGKSYNLKTLVDLIAEVLTEAFTNEDRYSFKRKSKQAGNLIEFSTEQLIKYLQK